MFVSIVDNSTMVEGGRMEGMNTNLPREECVRDLAQSFSNGVQDTSTLFVVAAASKEYDTPRTYLEANLRAIDATRREECNLSTDAEETAKALSDLGDDISTRLADHADMTWEQSFEVATWV
ncbi:unnamed protein product, partial [Ectocarpus fasciculatus]